MYCCQTTNKVGICRETRSPKMHESYYQGYCHGGLINIGYSKGQVNGMVLSVLIFISALGWY